MGGGIAQAVALRHLKLVASLTLVATSAVGGIGQLVPGPVIDWFLDSERAFAGQLGVDVAAVRSSAGSAFDRSQDLAAAGNRWLVVGQGGGPIAPR